MDLYEELEGIKELEEIIKNSLVNVNNNAHVNGSGNGICNKRNNKHNKKHNKKPFGERLNVKSFFRRLFLYDK